MAGLGRMKFSLSVMLLLQFAEPTLLLLHHTVREGDQATLSCDSGLKDPGDCGDTTWSFTRSYQQEVAVVKLGQKVAEETRSDRLSLTEDCCLVIKEVRAEDAGRYYCLHNGSGTEQNPCGEVSLSVVSMAEWRVAGSVTFFCFVTTDRCPQSVKLIFDRESVDKDPTFTRSESPCFISVMFHKSNVVRSWRNYFRCEVTDGVSSKLFLYRPRPSAHQPEEVKPTPAEPQDWSYLDYVMLSMRVAELVLVTVIAALLCRAHWNVASVESKPTSGRDYVNGGEIAASSKQR